MAESAATPMDTDDPMQNPEADPSPQAPLAGPSNPKGKRKRAENDQAVAGPSQERPLKKIREDAPPSSRAQKPKRPSDWHLKKDEIPAAAEQTKTALQLHCRALWALTHEAAVPPKVTEHDKTLYDRRFTSEAEVRNDVHASLNINATLIGDTQARIMQLKSALIPTSFISNNIRRISEKNLEVMFRSVACFGLQRWAPDILSSEPDSMYNLLHEHIALTTFEQVAGNYGYNFTGMNLSLIKDFPLMRSLYRNFVYSYMYSIAMKDHRKPGAVKKSKEMTAVYKRRTELKNNRIDALKAQGFNNRVISMVQDAEAHSDDELCADQDSDGEPVYKIKVKEGRCHLVKNLVRGADKILSRLAKNNKKQYRQPRTRVESEEVSKLTTLPRNTTIDWFSPDFWTNSLSVRERCDYIEHEIQVALPSTPELCNQMSEWKNLPEAEFMEKYGKATLAKYPRPTERELEQLEEYDGDKELDEEGDSVSGLGEE